jgi:hypothetical protein
VRHDRAGRYLADSQLSFLRYLPAERRLEVNTRTGPVFDTAPTSFGLYGNPGGSSDPDNYLTGNPFAELARGGQLNGADTAGDSIAGLCTAAFLWPFDVSAGVSSPSTCGSQSTISAVPLTSLSLPHRRPTTSRPSTSASGRASSMALASRSLCRRWWRTCSICTARAAQIC